MPDIAAASYGGFALYFEGSGSSSVECFSPRRLADSSAGAELIMSTWAGKSVVAYPMLHRELGMERLHPTPLQIDASAVTDGVQMERVSRQQRFQAARLAMLRFWQEERIIRLLKTDTDDMRADILVEFGGIHPNAESTQSLSSPNAICDLTPHTPNEYSI